MTLSATRHHPRPTRPRHVRQHGYGPLWLTAVCLAALTAVVALAGYHALQIGLWAVN